MKAEDWIKVEDRPLAMKDSNYSKYLTTDCVKRVNTYPWIVPSKIVVNGK